MSPRAADERVRIALIDTAARLLAKEGPEALTTRRIASEVGTSTMAVYTHFEGMGDLRRAVRLEWFNRLYEHLATVPKTTDPVADLAAIGWAYFFNSVENAHMFRITVVDSLPDPEVATAGAEAFQVLAGAIQRCADEGRLSSGDPAERALQIWMIGNGVLVACLAGFITVDYAIDQFYEIAWGLMASFGADPVATRKSIERGRRRMERRSKVAATNRARDR